MGGGFEVLACYKPRITLISRMPWLRIFKENLKNPFLLFETSSLLLCL